MLELTPMEALAMRMTLCVMVLSAAAACVSGVETTGGTRSDIKINPATDLTESAFVNGGRCTMVFPGGQTPQTEIYFIWAVGTNGIVDTTYNTPGRPNVYAVFANGPLVNQSDVHHVDGFDQFDHTHILDVKSRGDEVENTAWDVLGLFPGPNFNAATYVPATSVSAMFAQQAAGILGPVQTLPEVGLPPLVLYSPVNCP
jgi:hypothetical protein